MSSIGKVMRLIGIGVVLVVVMTSLAWGTSPNPPLPKASSQEQWVTLDRILIETAGTLEKENARLRRRLVEEKKALLALQQETEDLVTAMSTLKATLGVGKVPLPQAIDLLRQYAAPRAKVTERINKLTPELDSFKESLEESRKTQTDLAGQVQRLKDMELSSEARSLFLAHYDRYQQMAAERDALKTSLAEVLQSQLHLWQRQNQLLQNLIGLLEAYANKQAEGGLFTRQKSLALRVSLPQMLSDFRQIPSRFIDQFQGLTQPVLSGVLRANRAALIGLALFWVFLLYGGRRLRNWSLPHIRQWSERAESFSAKTVATLSRVMVSHALLIISVLVAAVALWTLDLFDNSPALIIFYGAVGWAVFWLGRDFIRATFEPRDPGHAVIVVDKATARFYYFSLAFFLAFLVAAQWFVDSLTLLHFQTNTLFLLDFIIFIMALLCCGWLLQNPHLSNLLAGLGLSPRSWGGRILRGFHLLAWPLLGAIVISDLLGYQILSLYLSSCLINTALYAVFFWILANLARDFCAYLTHPTNGILAQQVGIEAASLQTSHKLLPEAISTIILIGFVIVVLNEWGLKWSYLEKIITVLRQGPSLGPVNLSPLALILAAGSIYLARLMASLIRFILEKRVFTRTMWNVAAQNTISTAVNYGLMALGILLALGFLGVNLASLALIAGALGIGIGFGLQNIVNNFVSGLIILFERPIKVGDLLEIDGRWGEVKAIRVRSTLFETVDHCILIIPNSDLLSSKIQNWTHFERGAFRLTLKVGVAYGSEVEKVLAIIREVFQNNRRVLADPAPRIIFQTFGDSALEFTMRVYLRTIDDREHATHELNSGIYQALGAAGIEIPFPQRDLHVKTPPAADWTGNLKSLFDEAREGGLPQKLLDTKEIRREK